MRQKPEIEVAPDWALLERDVRQNRPFLRRMQEALLLGLLEQEQLTREQYSRCAGALSGTLDKPLPK